MKEIDENEVTKLKAQLDAAIDNAPSETDGLSSVEDPSFAMASAIESNNPNYRMAALEVIHERELYKQQDWFMLLTSLCDDPNEDVQSFIDELIRLHDEARENT